MSQSDEQILLEILRRIRNKQLAKKATTLTHDTHAICRYVDADSEAWKIRDSFTMLQKLFRSWPKSTQSVSYPVPDPRGISARLAYMEGRHHGMWVGEYGALRMELLEWMIEQLREYVDVQSR